MPELHDLLRAEILLVAEQPIAHHAQTFGNEAVIMRRRIRSTDGMVDVPIITGDAMRHGLRSAASDALLITAGLTSDCLSEEALRFLYNGGVIGGAGSGLSMEDYGRLRQDLPHLPLFGGCVGNRQIPGQLRVSDALLCCTETAGMVPAWVAEILGRQQLEGSRSHIELATRVRFDATLEPARRRLLTPSARASAEGRLLASARASEEEDAVGAEQSKSTMMPRSFETVVAGSLFFWSVEARLYSELERDTFFVAVRSFLEHAYVGGKQGTGHGLLRPISARGVALMPMASERAPQVDGLLTPDAAIGELYRRHVSTRTAEIKQTLDRLVA